MKNMTPVLNLTAAKLILGPLELARENCTNKRTYIICCFLFQGYKPLTTITPGLSKLYNNKSQAILVPYRPAVLLSLFVGPRVCYIETTWAWSEKSTFPIWLLVNADAHNWHSRAWLMQISLCCRRVLIDNHNGRDTALLPSHRRSLICTVYIIYIFHSLTHLLLHDITSKLYGNVNIFSGFFFSYLMLIPQFCTGKQSFSWTLLLNSTLILLFCNS